MGESRLGQWVVPQSRPQSQFLRIAVKLYTRTELTVAVPNVFPCRSSQSAELCPMEHKFWLLLQNTNSFMFAEKSRKVQ